MGPAGGREPVTVRIFGPNTEVVIDRKREWQVGPAAAYQPADRSHQSLSTSSIPLSTLLKYGLDEGNIMSPADLDPEP